MVWAFFRIQLLPNSSRNHLMHPCLQVKLYKLPYSRSWMRQAVLASTSLWDREQETVSLTNRLNKCSSLKMKKNRRYHHRSSCKFSGRIECAREQSKLLSHTTLSCTHLQVGIRPGDSDFKLQTLLFKTWPVKLSARVILALLLSLLMKQLSSQILPRLNLADQVPKVANSLVVKSWVNQVSAKYSRPRTHQSNSTLSP